MLAFKGFNEKLQATRGKGTFQFEPGKTYKEKECKCAKNGFHCAENPLCAMSYYGNKKERYFIVRAEGDINQDGAGSRISCTEMTLVKEISRAQLGAYACQYIAKHPKREEQETNLSKEKGTCGEKDDFVIVRGKDPKGKGVQGSYVFLLQEEKNSKEIKGIYAIYIDGHQVKANTFYGVKGDQICERMS